MVRKRKSRSSDITNSTIKPLAEHQKRRSSMLPTYSTQKLAKNKQGLISQLEQANPAQNQYVSLLEQEFTQLSTQASNEEIQNEQITLCVQVASKVEVSTQTTPVPTPTRQTQEENSPKTTQFSTTTQQTQEEKSPKTPEFSTPPPTTRRIQTSIEKYLKPPKSPAPAQDRTPSQENSQRRRERRQPQLSEPPPQFTFFNSQRGTARKRQPRNSIAQKQEEQKKILKPLLKTSKLSREDQILYADWSQYNVPFDTFLKYRRPWDYYTNNDGKSPSRNRREITPRN